MKPIQIAQSTTAVLLLCPNCGLCCNGVLFANVELRKSDDAGRLAGLGLSVEKKGRKQAFAQPCACFDGRLCGIYAERPVRCRTFECGLLKRVQASELGANAALKTIVRARRKAEKVRGLLRELGQRDEQLALTERYGQAMTAPVDLSGGKVSAGLSGKLMLAFRDLMRTLQSEFLE